MDNCIAIPWQCVVLIIAPFVAWGLSTILRAMQERGGLRLLGIFLGLLLIVATLVAFLTGHVDPSQCSNY